MPNSVWVFSFVSVLALYSHATVYSSSCVDGSAAYRTLYAVFQPELASSSWEYYRDE